MPPPPSQTPPTPKPTTIRTLRRMAREKTPFACLTCYEAVTAGWLSKAGVRVLLVGDTAAEVVLGYPSTIHMPIDVAVALTAGVKRGAPEALVMGDMPFMSYQTGEDEAVRNAGRFLTEGLADVVKLEADASFAPLVSKLTRAGIPVCAHVGSRPQAAGLNGGYGAAGRTPESAQQVVKDAVELERAGAVLLLVEAVPPTVTQAILDATSAPLIGIGAGPACHGQILVLHDLLGLTEQPPPFADPTGQLGGPLHNAASDWVRRVAQRRVTDHRFETAQTPAAQPS